MCSRLVFFFGNAASAPKRAEDVLARAHEQVGGQLAQRGDGDRVVGGGRLEQDGLETARDGVASGELMRRRGQRKREGEGEREGERG